MIIAGCLELLPSLVVAQRVADLQTIPAQLTERGFTPHLPDIEALAGRRTYWLEGAAIGGVLLGVLGYNLSGACPANTGSCPGRLVGFGIGATLGLVVGAFLGDTIEKAP
jgi:hypothetical protein